MDRPDPRASQHGIGGFGDHRQVDGDTVAFFDAVRFQHIGEFAHFAVQFLIGDVPGFIGIVAFPDDGGLVGAFGEMAVDAIQRDIGLSVLEPVDRDLAGGIGHVLDFGEGLDPVDTFAMLAPERIGIADGLFVHGLVLGIVHPCAFRPLCRNGINFLGHAFSPRSKAVY